MVNKVILVGNVGKDPEIRQTQNNKQVATFSLATSESYKDQSGQRQSKTEWHNVVCWGNLAQLAGQYIKKGSKVYLDGKITTRSWDDNNGNKRYTTEIIANTIQFLDKREQSNQDGLHPTVNNQWQNNPVPPPAPDENDLPF